MMKEALIDVCAFLMAIGIFGSIICVIIFPFASNKNALAKILKLSILVFLIGWVFMAFVGSDILEPLKFINSLF